MLTNLSAPAWANPFFAGNPTTESDEKNEEQELIEPSAPTKRSLSVSLLAPVFAWQQKVYRSVSQKLSAFRDAPAPLDLVIILGLSFLYGALHALGPGHGKVISATWFSVRSARWYHAVGFSLSTAFLHALTAFLIMLILKVVLNTFTMIRFDALVQKARLASFGLIILTGVTLFVLRLLSHFRTPKDDKKKQATRLGFWGMVLAIGIVPCPGALIIMLFAYSMNMFWLGGSAVLAMSLGMGLSMALVNLLVLGGRTGAVQALERCGIKNQSGRIRLTLELTGAILIILLGLIFLLGEWQFGTVI